METRLRTFWVFILKVSSDDFEGTGKRYKTNNLPTKSVDLKGRKVKKRVGAREVAVLLARPTFYGGRRELVAPFGAVDVGIWKKRMFFEELACG